MLSTRAASTLGGVVQVAGRDVRDRRMADSPACFDVLYARTDSALKADPYPMLNRVWGKPLVPELRSLF